jgi:PAS domain-containing protein
MSTSLDKTFEKTRSEFSFREILEFTPVGILIFQRDWKIKFVNTNFFQFSGVMGEIPEDLIGKSIFENRLFSDADIRDDLTLVKNGQAFEREIISTQTLSGGKYSIILKGAPVVLEGEYTGGVLVLEDLKSSPEKSYTSLIQTDDFQKFLGTISDFYLVTDNEGSIKIMQSTEAENYDFIFETDTNKKNLSQNLSSILFKKLLENVVSSNKVVTTQIPFIRNQREINARITLIPFSDNGEEVHLVVLLLKDLSKDSDQIGLSEEEINELTKYQQITATVMDGLIGTNKNGKITFWNESAAKLFGLTRSEVYGKNIGKIFPTLNENYF